MFHRLRVLNFSKSFLSDGTYRSKPKKLNQERNAERNTSITINISKTIEEPVCSKEIAKQSCVKFNDVEESAGSECEASSPMFQRNLTIRKKSLSETSNCPSKKYSLRNLSRRKTLSSCYAKKRRTRKRHRHYKNIKLAFKSFKKDIGIKRSRRKIKRTPKDLKVEFVTSSNELLQSKSTRKYVNLNNKLTCRRRRKQFDASTSYTDMFGFCKKKNLLDPKPLYQMGKNDDNIFWKLKRRSAAKRKNINEQSRTCSRSHQPCRVVSSELGDDRSFYSTRLHYNLGDISRCPCMSNKIRPKESEIPHLKKDAKNDANLICSHCNNAPPQEKKNSENLICSRCNNAPPPQKKKNTNLSYSRFNNAPPPEKKNETNLICRCYNNAPPLQKKKDANFSCSCFNNAPPPEKKNDANLICSCYNYAPPPEKKNDANSICSRCNNAPPPEKKNVSISCMKLKVASFIDAACSTSKGVEIPSPLSSVSCTRKSNQSNRSKYVMCKKCLKKTVSCKRKRPMAHNVPYTKTRIFRKFQGFSEKLHHKRDIQGRTVLKYVILTIVAVAWSPCVLAIACGWLLTYPLRPHQVIRENSKDKCQEECSSYYSNNNSVWALMVGNMKSAFNKTVSTGSAIKSLLISDRAHKVKSHQIKTSPTLINSGTTFPKQSQHPNPQRRYTLSYSDERGWVMKPVRQRKRNRERIGVFSQALQKIVCGCAGASNAMRQDPNIFAYNVTAETKLNCESPDVSNKSIKSSCTQKLPVDAKSKHFALLNKPVTTNRFKTELHADACRKCCRDHHKTYINKKTGGESIARESKVTCTETELFSTEPTKPSPSGNPKVTKQSRPNMLKAYQCGKSSTAPGLFQPYTPSIGTMFPICSKCCKRHSGQSPKSVNQRPIGYRETNGRCQRRRTPCSSGSIILLPKRSMSTLSICRPNPCRETCRIPKRSRSECRERTTEPPCCRCKSPLSRSKIGSKGDFEDSRKLSKKVSFKKNLTKIPTKITKSPADEHISIKVRKKKKEQPKPEDDKDKKKNIKSNKPVVVLQKMVPAAYRRKNFKKEEYQREVEEEEHGRNYQREVEEEEHDRNYQRKVEEGERGRKRERRRRSRNRGCCDWFGRCDRGFRDMIWPVPHLNCRDLYLYTMRKRPCFWVYERYPKFYPRFLELYNCFMICCHSCMFCLSVILWAPCFLGAYACLLCWCDFMSCPN